MIKLGRKESKKEVLETSEEKIERLERELAITKEVIDDLLLGGELLG